MGDLSETEPASQLVDPHLPANFPLPSALSKRLHNLPVQLTAFVGRARELGEVEELLATARLLTLTGTGGCGKTRLALRAAEQLLNDYVDGVWFVELAPLAEPELVPHAVASSVGVLEEAGQAVEQTLVAALRSKRTLLILDNCEHLLGPCAVLVEALLKSCPGLRVLATSRESLGVAGEVSWRVPSLGLPPPPVRVIFDASQMRGEVEGLQGYEAVRLFVDRAAAALPSFVLTEKNGPAVAQICRRLDGIPLAIELAAARVKALAPEHIAERLGQRFRLLTGGSRTALPRHQTLRALVDWSYGLLTTSEQSLFHRLAVFVGGFDLEAAEEVCAGGAIETAAVMDLLLRLVDKSLVVVESGDGGAQRFRLLETLRQYGMERLVATGEADAAHERHAAYFMRVGEETDPLLRGPRPRAAFDRVELEQDNMRTALRWLAEDGTPDQAMRLAAVLGWFWYVRGYNSEGRGWLAETLARPAELPPSSTRSRVCWLAALLAYRQGDLDAARTLNEESLAIGQAAADAVRISQARLLSGVLHRDQGDYRAARSAFEESLSTAQGAGDGFSTALGHYWLGIVALDEGDCTTARTRLEEGLAVRRRIEDRWACCTSLERLAEVALQQRDYPAARGYADESLAIAREIGYPQGVARSLRCLGTLALVRGEATAAREKYAEALTIWRSMGDRAAIAHLLEESATTAVAQGAPGRALRLAGAAAGLRGALGMRLSPTGRDRTARALAPARRALGSDAAAAWTAGEALTLEQAIEMVLVDEAPEGPYAPDGVGPLTARECDVAVLIGRGMGNRQIADELVVSVRTVESHVASIRAKLDLDSRAKIAVWALKRGLLG